MCIKIILGKNSVAYHLSKDIRVNVGHLLADNYLGDYFGSSGNEADSHSGRNHFREASRIDDPALGIERLHRGNVLSRKSQLAVGIVLDDDEVMSAGKFINSLSSCSGHTSSRGVLEIGDNVKKLAVFVVLNGLFKTCDADALVVHFNTFKVSVI